MRTVHGLAFPDADQFMAQQLGADGRYQGDHLDAALAYVTDWSVACDGGAHAGTWTRQLATRFQRVIAVEPAPDTFEALRLNVHALDNVDLRNVALGAVAGSVSLTWDAKNEARANTGARYVQPDGSIPMVAIDTWNLPALGFLKLDVEGSEFPALLGARNTLIRCHPVVLFEEKGFGRRLGVTPGAAQQLLASLGYRKATQFSADQIWTVTS